MASSKNGTKRLGLKDERFARSMCYPANFAEVMMNLRLYPKQKQAINLARREGSCTSIAAANGAGKTSHLIPALVAWHMWMYPAGRIKITSGSWPQIDTQIWPSIEEKVKPMFPERHWLETPRCTYWDPETRKEGFLDCFSTNDPGRAEGAHADGEYAPLLYIVDEAKTVPPFLRRVVEARIRPTRLVLLSSQGYMEGWFFESQTTLEKFNKIQIHAEDCAHISKEEIEQVRRDWIAYPEFADAVLGWGFMPLVEDAVINGPALDACIANPPPHKPGEVHGFCDFAWSGSGAENTFFVRDGNKITMESAFRCGHLTATAKKHEPGIVETFQSHFDRMRLRAEQISGDDAGGGKLVMDAFEERGLYLNRVNNGATANNPDAYANIGAEMWYEAGKLITAGWPIIPNDRVLRSQLMNRKRAKSKSGKLAIESKEDMVKRGVQSPDRADGFCGSMLPCGGFGIRPLSMAIPVKMGNFEGLSDSTTNIACSDDPAAAEMEKYRVELEEREALDKVPS